MFVELLIYRRIVFFFNSCVAIATILLEISDVRVNSDDVNENSIFIPPDVWQPLDEVEFRNSLNIHREVKPHVDTYFKCSLSADHKRL